MKLDTIHHIAIIGRDRDAMLHFYVDGLGFAIVSEYDRPERRYLDQSRQGQPGLRTLYQIDGPRTSSSPCLSMRDCVIWPLKWTM